MRFNRRSPALVLFVLVPVVLLALYPLDIIKPGTPAATPTVAALGEPTLPFVPTASFINSSWFCGGVPNVPKATGGSVTVANPGEAPLTGRLTVFSDAPGSAAVEKAFEVAARGTYSVVLADIQPQGTYLSAMVEIAGGGGFVEQKALAGEGLAVSPCSNSTSSNWYFADDYTLNGSTEDLVITNPYPDDAILEFTFASNDGTRRPQSLQGFPVPAKSVAVVSQANMPKDEAVLAVTVHASRGRVVVARAQHYFSDRSGFTLSLGAPSLSNQWWFADGEHGAGVTKERYSIYNPTDQDVTVSTNVWGIVGHPEFVGLRTDTIPAGNVVSFTTDDLPGLPDGRHGMTFATDGNSSVVVERGLTRKAEDGSLSTSVVMGAPAPFNAFQHWSMAIGPAQSVDASLVVMNLDGAAGTVTVKYLSPGGELVVPGLEKVALPASGVITLTVPDQAGVLGAPLLIEATQRIVVERSLPRLAGAPGRTGSLALPG
jgi:hypothetical protein